MFFAVLVLILSAFAAFYLAVCVVLYRRLFVPARPGYLDDFCYTPWEFQADYEDVDLVTPDGVQFGVWFLRQPGSQQVIVISASGKNSKLAQQLAQEAAVVFSQLVGERFKTTPQLRATILDPAHVVGGPNRHVLRNVLIGSLIGLIVGTVVAGLFVPAPLAPAQAPPESVRELMRREKLLERHLGSV